jgi:hypothetical protein
MSCLRGLGHLKVILFVKSVKTVMDTYARSYVRYTAQTIGAYGSYNVREIPDYKTSEETVYENMLPEDQRAVVEMVKKAAVKHGFVLEVIDVTEEGALGKLEDRLMGVSTFPTLLTDSGIRIEGDTTEERIEALFKKQNAKQKPG